MQMFMLINLYLLWWVGASLEQHWGAFKFNVYYFTGVLAAIIAAYFTGAASSMWLTYSVHARCSCLRCSTPPES